MHVLIDATTRLPVAIGDTVETFRGERATVTGFEPPHREGTSGRVSTTLGHHYASVYNCEYLTETPEAPSYFGRKCFRVAT